MTPILGVQMFTLRQFTQSVDDLAFAITRIREIGYRSIQVSAFGDIPPSETARICKSAGVAIGGTHVAWDRFRFDLDRVIDEHLEWECKHSAIGMIPPKTYLSLAGLARFLDELQPVAEKLAANGIDFSYHNHAHEFRHFNGKPWLAHLYDAAPANLLKAELDTHWIVAGGADPVAWINHYGNRMSLLHLKDFALNADGQRIFAAIGDGNMNWPAILAAAAQQDIAYYFVEQDNCYGEDEFKCLQRSYDFLHQSGLA